MKKSGTGRGRFIPAYFVMLFLSVLFLNPNQVNAQCTAGFTSNPSGPIIGCDPLNVLFYSNTTGTVVNRVWNFGNGATSTAQNPSQVFAAGSTDTVYNCYLAIECSNSSRDTAFFTVTVRARPRSTFTANKANVCALTDSICFTNTSSTGSGYSYSWDFGDFTSSSQFSPCHVYNAPGSYTVKLTVTNNYGCIKQSSQSINVNDVPNTNFNVSSSFGCTPFTVSFTNNTVAGSSAIVSWKWAYGDTSTPTVLQNSPPHTYYTNGTYVVTLTATNSSGCSNINTRTIIVSTTPTVAINAPATICQGDTALISYSGNANPAGTYVWGVSGGTIISGSGQGPLAVIWNSSGTKTLALSVTNTNGCSNGASKNIIVLPKPVINMTSSKDTVCEGDTVTFTVSPSGYAQNLFYNHSSLLVSQPQNVYTINSFLLSMLVRARVIDSNGCYSEYDTAGVYVKTNPSVSLSKSPVNDTVCQGTSITYTASPSTYTAYLFKVGFAPAQNGSSNVFTSSSVGSNVPVTVFATNNGCTGSSSSAISTTVLQRLPAPQVFCGTGTTSTLTFQWLPITGAIGYKVSVNGGAFSNPSSGGSGTIHTVSGLNQGDSAYIRVVAYDNSICNYGDTSLSFKCYALPCTPVSMTITPSASVACEGNSFSVSLSNISVPKYSISWDSMASYGTQTFYNYTAQTGKTYYVYVIDSAQLNCPPTQRSIPITVNAVPSVSLSKTPNTSPICANTSVTFTATPLNYSLYRFYNGSTLIQQSASPYYTTSSLPTSNNIHVVAVNNNCSSPASNSISTTVIASSSATLTSTVNLDTICQGDLITFTATPGTYQTYKFYNGSTLIQSGGNNQMSVSNWPSPNSIYVVALDASGCNTDTSNVFSYYVKNTPSLTLSSPVNGDSICLGSLATFTVSPSGLALYQFYINGNLVQSGSSNSYASSSMADSQIVTAKASIAGCQPVNQTNSIMVRVKNRLNAPVVSCGSSTNTSIQFVWNAVNGAIGYQVSINGSAFNYPNTGQTGTSHILSGLSPGDSATIVVRALSGMPCDTSLRSQVVKCYAVPCNGVSYSLSTLPSNICVGDSLNVYITNISTSNYSVSWEGGTFGPDTTFKFLVNSDTLIHVRLRDNTQPACPLANKVFNIVTFKTPGITITSNAPVGGICEGAPVTFTATSINSNYVYSSYKFYNGSTLLQSSSSNTFTTSSLQPGNSIYVIASSNSCQDVSSPISLNIFLKQKVYLSCNVAADSLCRGVPVTYTISPPTYSRFTFFNNSASLQDSTLNTITLSSLSNPNIIYGRGTDANGCNSLFSDTISKYIFPPTSVSLVSTAPGDTLCENTPVTFVASPSGYKNYEFLLDFVQVQNGTSNIYTTNALNSSHFVKVVSLNAFGCYDTSQSNYRITVINRLQKPIVYCGNTTLSSIQFRWDTVPDASGYLVSVNGGSFITPSSGYAGLSHLISGLNTGDSATIRVLAYSFRSPCAYGDTSLQAMCFALPCNFVAFTASSSVPSACTGDTVQFSVSGISTPNYSVSFDNKATYKVKTYDSVKVAMNTNYTVYLIDSTQLACPPFYRTIPINVNPIPVANLSADKDTICQTTQVNFTALPAGYANYKYFINASMVQDSALHLYSSTQIMPGDAVRVRVTDKGCSSTTSPYYLYVVAPNKLALTNSSTNDTLCNQSPVTFNSAPVSYVNYKFYNNGVVLQDGPSSSFTSSSLPVNNKIYVVARDMLGCEIHYSDTDQLFIKPMKFVGLSGNAPLNKICQYDNLFLTANPANSFLSYRFRLNGVTVQDSIINTLLLSNLANGDSIQVFGLDSNGCNALSNILKISVQKRPVLTLTGDTLVCAGDTVTVIATPDQNYPGITYLWNTNDTSQTLKTIPLSSALFSVTATVNNCPSASATRFVQVDSAAKPIADAGISRYGCIGDTVILSGTGGAKYAWKPANLLSLPNTQHPSYFVFTTQQFTLTVTNIKCSSTDTITILADKCLDDISFIPQIITVNNDGVNDLFYIPDIDYFTNNTVTIYNRWGDEVFQAHPYLNTFDGTGKGGKNLPEGAYYYVIDLANGKAKIHKGIFMIER